MVQISEYDISVYEQYAKGKQGLEEFLKIYQVPIGATGIIAAQAAHLGLVPHPPPIVQLTGENLKKNWSTLVMPEGFLNQRSTSSFILPSLSEDQLAADRQKLERVVTMQQDPAASQQGHLLTSLVEEVTNFNNLVKEVQGRMLQLLPA